MAYSNVTGTNANNFMAFTGLYGFYDETLINPYSGFTVHISGYKNVNNAIYDGRGGTDTLAMTTQGDVLTLTDRAGTIMISNVEIFNAGADGDIINLSHATLTYGNVVIRGADGDDVLWSNAGNDLIQGGAGQDMIHGGGGNDSLYGGDGNDHIAGGSGTDSLFGGAGNDTLAYNADSLWTGGVTLAALGSALSFASSVVLDGMNRSYDTFHGDADDSLQVGAVGFDTLVMTGGADVLVLSDTLSPANGLFTPRVAYMDVIEAGDGDDIIDLSGAAHGDVTLHGGAGNDIVAGSAGHDTIHGEDGDDRISGGAGNDHLFGGGGDDAYYFSAGSGADRIRESAGSDKIILGAGLTLEDVALHVDGRNLVLTMGGDSITIENHYADDYAGRVENLVFQDGSVFDLAAFTGNDAPAAHNDSFSGKEDSPLSGNVLANDTDPDNDTLSVAPQTILTQNGGTVTLSADGSFTYQGALNWHGTESFSYTAFDPAGLSAAASVLLTIAPVNDAPEAGDDALAGLRGAVLSGAVLANDTDIDGDALSVLSGNFSTAHGGTVSMKADGTFSYTATDGFFGRDSFDYTLRDSSGATDTASVSLDIALNPADSIIGTDTGETLTGTGGDDEMFALGGADILVGGDGADTLYGGAGDDILYGDDSILTGTVLDKVFSDTVLIPTLKEGVHISKLKPSGEPARGIADGNLSVDFDATATITFRKGYAGYDNSFGTFAIAADGRIVQAEIEWANVKTAGIDTAHRIDIPGGPSGGAYGFFLVENGNNANAGYAGLDITGDGKLSFVYNHGKADARAAKITDAGAKISLVYNDGTITKVLKGNIFFSTERDDSAALNKDGKIHVVSGLMDRNNLTLNPLAADLAARPVSFTKNGMTLTALSGTLIASGNKIGIKSALAAGGNLIAGEEKIHIAFAQGAEKITLSLSDIAGGNTAIDFRIYLNGDMASPLVHEYVLGSVTGGKADIVLDSTLFGTGNVVTGIQVASLANSAQGTETFYLDNVFAEIPGGVDTDTIRIGFEDLYNIGDGDYEDVLFDLNIDKRIIGDVQGGNDILDGGAGNDLLYGEGGNDILVLGLGADTAHGGEGADIFALTHPDAFTDKIMDFDSAEGDRINIADLLQSYDPLADDIAAFVRLVQKGTDTELHINADGAGDDFVAAALIVGGTGGADLAALVTGGVLIADHGAF